MDRPTLEVADIFRRYGDRSRDGAALSTAQRRVMTAIETGRTAVLGGPVEPCDACVNTSASPTIPVVIGMVPRAHRWHAPRGSSGATPTYWNRPPYFHVVLTVPDDIAAIAFQNKAVVYALLFRTETLRTIAADPQHLGAEIGFFAVWHTWGQTLAHHPHLHGVVPGGGLSRDGRRWVACRPGCFLPVRVRSRLFRRRLLEAWHAACEAGTWPCFGTLHALADRQACVQDLAPARQTEWVVYAKPPCAGPPRVLDDVGRDTHRVAIAHSRLLDREAGQGRFRYTDDRDDDHPQRTMTLAAAACIRRVLLHVLPARFPRLRHDGRLGNRHRKEHLARCRQRLGTTVPETLASASTAPRDDRDRYEALTGISLRTCPVCRDGHMRIVEHVARARWAAAITDTS